MYRTYKRLSATLVNAELVIFFPHPGVNCGNTSTDESRLVSSSAVIKKIFDILLDIIHDKLTLKIR